MCINLDTVALLLGAESERKRLAECRLLVSQESGKYAELAVLRGSLQFCWLSWKPRKFGCAVTTRPAHALWCFDACLLCHLFHYVEGFPERNWSSLAESSEVQNVRGLVTLEGRGHALCVLCGKKVLKCYLVSCVFLVSVIVHADTMEVPTEYVLLLRDFPGWEQEQSAQVPAHPWRAHRPRLAM